MSDGSLVTSGAAGVEKVCPVVLRAGASGREILVFEHPTAGVQLVKGTREADETVSSAALRELAEESGLSGPVWERDLGRSTDIAAGEVWHFALISAEHLPDQWDFDTLDDYGHRFSFFWWPLNRAPDGRWHPRFTRALDHILSAL